MTGGIIYGSNAEAGLTNTASKGGAAVYIVDKGTATVNGGTQVSTEGTLQLE
jgi:hypothetical protein